MQHIFVVENMLDFGFHLKKENWVRQKHDNIKDNSDDVT